MIPRMSPKRVIAAAVLVVAAGMVACIIATDAENGSDCLKDFDCASKLCVAGKCVAQNGDLCQTDQGCASGKCIAGKCFPVIVFDSGTPLDAEDSSVDSAPESTPDASVDSSAEAADSAETKDVADSDADGA